MSNPLFGFLRKRPYFEGWYFKHQSPQHTLILIPAWHVDSNGGAYGSLQIILVDQVHRIILPPEPTVSVPLLAPKAGTMERIIEEHPRCPIRWQLYRGKDLIFDQESPDGSYELA